MQRSRAHASIRFALLATAVAGLACSGHGPGEQDAEARAAAGIETVDDARLRNATSEPESWLTYGGSYAEQRYSRLDRIDATNVGELGLAWSFETNTKRGLEATPIVVDGVIYTTGTWSVVFAIDARTGKLLWRHDPAVPRATAGLACCDVVNRGVAVYAGRVYAATLDGRLQALDARTGEVVWSVRTVDPSRPYTITMAPRIVKGRVILGNGGAEYGVRGYVSAYDAQTGELAWRFYTVPGDPSKPYEHPELEQAARTWDPSSEYWVVGGGGTAWNSVAFDPDLDLLYVGTGNGSPWSHEVRSEGGGDNLFVCSILALDPDSGRLVWHYQTTPGDQWDYTSTQDIVLADLEIEGRPRKVLMHAPKNGFFYVIDRETGVPISAEPFVPINWAKGMDRSTWRPIVDESLDYENEIVTIMPSPHGAHNWHPMSFNPETGLVYVPAQESVFFFKEDPDWEYEPGSWNVGYDKTILTISPPDVVSGHLLAWDPIAQKEAWRVQYAGPWNGGTLTTAGNLVFQGTAHGTFAAYRATDGAVLWEQPSGTGIIAAPVTYLLDGEQYVAVMAGWGGSFPLSAGEAAKAAGVHDLTGRLLVYKLGGQAKLPVHEVREREIAALPADFTPEEVQAGSDTYHRWCLVCHGPGAISGGVLPDLRKAAPEIYDSLEAIVLGGAFEGNGMPRFDRWLEPTDVAKIRTYLLARRARMLAGDPSSPR
ncbi:MAG: PQQ-dependent dehydrogenase, methanol/ethanol family [Spirochaetaceae bacterium]|nr:PQQ-dependent dehydrogenase, methanol/ethanol family [Spirochaetaceae bacterium]